MTRSTGLNKASLAALFMLLGFIWIPMSIHESSTDTSQPGTGYFIGRHVVGPLLPWIISAVLAIIAIVKERGEIRLWPAYTSLVVIVGCFVLAAPTFMSQQNYQPQIRAGMQRVLVAAQPLTSASSGCASQAQHVCTSTELTTFAHDQGVTNIQASRDCRTPSVICVSDTADGGRRVEMTTEQMPAVGIIRVDSIISPDGSHQSGCSSLAPKPDPEALRWVCGRGMFSVEELPQQGPLP